MKRVDRVFCHGSALGARSPQRAGRVDWRRLAAPASCRIPLDLGALDRALRCAEES
jgi:hypothetical protein